MNQTATTKRPSGYLFDDDFTDAAFEAPQTTTPEEIRKEAHIANGGEAEFKCPKCHGTGIFRGYARTFNCFKCKGSGKVSKGVAAAAKGKATREANKLAFREEHADLIASLTEISDWNNFAKTMLDGLDTYGSWKDWQIDKARTMLAKIAEKREAKRAEREAANSAKSGEVGVDRITELFATAIGNGLKKPMFRTERLTIKRAPEHGRNAGALYVTDSALGGEYVGKIVGGRFEARREAKPDTLKLLCEIAEDPLEAAVKYGRSTGNCGICGRELTDPESVAAGIGPICQGKWSL